MTSPDLPDGIAMERGSQSFAGTPSAFSPWAQDFWLDLATNGWALPVSMGPEPRLFPFTTRATPYRLHLIAQLPPRAFMEHCERTRRAGAHQMPYRDLWVRIHREIAAALLNLPVDEGPGDPRCEDMTYVEAVAHGVLPAWMAAARLALEASSLSLTRPVPKGPKSCLEYLEHTISAQCISIDLETTPF